jgi:hypothetical protein
MDFSHLELKNLESAAVDKNFEECELYVLERHPFFTASNVKSDINNLFNDIKNSGSHDFFHWFCLRNISFWKGMSISSVRNFYLVNAYSSECNDFFCCDLAREDKIFLSLNLLELRRIGAILQKIDTIDSWMVRMRLISEMKVLAFNELNRHHRSKDKDYKSVRNIIKSGLLLHFDSDYGFVDCVYGSDYSIANFKCLCRNDALIADLSRIAHLNNSRTPDSLMGYDLKNNRLVTQPISREIAAVVYLPDVLYHPVEEWNSAHSCIFEFFSDLLKSLPRNIIIIPYNQDYNGSASPRIASTIARYIFSYHTGACDINVFDSGVKGDFIHIHFKESYLPGSFTFDMSGYSGWRKVSAGGNVFLQKKTEQGLYGRSKKFLDDTRAKRSTKYEQDYIETIPVLKYPILFYPMQIVDDSVARLADISTLQLLDVLLSLSNRMEFSLLIKRHPLCRNPSVDKALQAVSSLDRVQITKAHVYDAINCSSAVVVVNSGVGFEAIALGKPVICTGESDYSEAALNARTVEALEECINLVLDNSRKAKNDLLQETSSRFCLEYLRQCVLKDEEGYKQSLRNKIKEVLV